jgi:serine/threonine-protein kinase
MDHRSTGGDDELQHATGTRNNPPQIGAYEIVELLNRGGMGTVWRGRHRFLGRDTAIKVIRFEQQADEGARARFALEARVTASLTSPHIVRVFDFGASGAGELFYSMELLRGCDLEELVRRFGPLPGDRALFLLEQVCDAISEVHERGLVHADIKPANLFASRAGLEYDFAKVLDFGLVHADNEPRFDIARTPGGLAWATPAYMAPEAVLEVGSVDRRTDVYALGCVAYFLLTGQLVFEADTATDILWQHVHTDPAPPSTRTAGAIAPEIDALILACLRKDPLDRPDDAADLRRRIAGIRTGAWDSAAAKRWWAAHLPDVIEPSNDRSLTSLPRDRELILTGCVTAPACYGSMDTESAAQRIS